MTEQALWPFWLMAVVLHALVAVYYFGTDKHTPIELTGESGKGIEVGLDQSAYQAMMQLQEAKQAKQAKKAQALKQAKTKPQKPKVTKQLKSQRKPQKLTVKPIAKPAVKHTAKPIAKPVITPMPMQNLSSATPMADHSKTEQNVDMPSPAYAELPTTQTTQVSAMTVNHSQTVATTDHADSKSVSVARSTPGTATKALGKPAPLVMNDATKRYIRKLMRHLSQFKEYPGALKKAHIEGTPIIRFTFNQAGEVLETTIKKRSKHKALDQAAMEVFKKANPLPPIPQALKRDTLTMSLPIEFDLIND